MSARVGGVIPAVVTPFAPGGGPVDLDALDAHIAWLHDRGVDCVAPLGTNGEGPSLSLRERLVVIERLAAHPSGITILPGTGAAPLPEAIELGRFAFDHGAAGILAALPAYFPAERDGVLRYYGKLLDALGQEARVFLYNIPAYAGVAIEVEHLVELREAYGDRVAGLKDSAGDLDRTVACKRAAPGAIVLSGSDATVDAAFRAGVDGVVSALANAVPDRVEAVRAAVAAGNSGAEEQAVLTALRRRTKAVPQRAALKALVAEAAGVRRGAVRPPLAELTASELEDLLQGFRELVTGAEQVAGEPALSSIARVGGGASNGKER